MAEETLQVLASRVDGLDADVRSLDTLTRDHDRRLGRIEETAAMQTEILKDMRTNILRDMQTDIKEIKSGRPPWSIAMIITGLVGLLGVTATALFYALGVPHP